MIFTANQELIVRLSVFTGTLLLMLCWEQLAPRRPAGELRWRRRLNNLLLVGIDTLLLRLLIPLAAISAASIAALHGWGLFNHVELPRWLAAVLAFLLLDLLVYWQHRLFHWSPFLWRFHRVHHSDTEFDVSTGVRFHPVEILLSMCIKIAAVVATGAPVLAVLIFEIVLNASSLFNHGNVRLAPGFDRLLRLVLVTPDMHRVHHSAIAEETDSNFGFTLPWWDRLFASYRAQPQLGHEKLKVGLNEFRDQRFVKVLWMLKQPLLNSAEFIDDDNQTAI